MKPEPLKEKLIIYGSRIEGILPKVAKEQDIKSAVEWYSYYLDCPKILIEDYPKYKTVIPRLKTSYNSWLLKKAFEDVLK